ncbi:hypothetical protein P389DRAFT_92665 [Cystobasidium minutum MCA 4210]|uniref:uncharacterized protein n=1 Tax=Cystobasidium minutum MCA 4210 TaxID=1397322 RepID=UPI0034CE6533|eukprot:jgi/Rhomi1/92665/CE92664_152
MAVRVDERMDTKLEYRRLLLLLLTVVWSTAAARVVDIQLESRFIAGIALPLYQPMSVLWATAPEVMRMDQSVPVAYLPRSLRPVKVSLRRRLAGFFVKNDMYDQWILGYSAVVAIGAFGYRQSGP